LLITFVCSIASNAFAANYGIGIGISANISDRHIYLPVKVTDNFKTELSFRYYDSDNNSDLYE